MDKTKLTATAKVENQLPHQKAFSTKSPMNKLWCLFGLHDWWCIHVEHYIDISYSHQADSTTAVWRCTTCATVKEKNFYGIGNLEMAELNRQPTDRSPPLKLLLGGKNRHDKS